MDIDKWKHYDVEIIGQKTDKPDEIRRISEAQSQKGLSGQGQETSDQKLSGMGVGHSEEQKPPETTINKRIKLLTANIHPLEKLRQLTQIYPEMKKLTHPVSASPEAHALVTDKTFGEQIFDLPKEAVIEYNRTAVCLRSLEHVITGNYNDFTACQKDPNLRLTRESFKALQGYTKKILPSPEALDAMTTYLVINDLGKVDSVKSFIEQKAGRQADHDAVLSTVLDKHSSLSPSFERLSPHYKEIIRYSLRADFNVAQFIQGENVPANLEKVRYLNADAREFHVLHTLYDIAGAAGQFVQNGSIVMQEHTFQAYQAAMEALQEAKVGEKPERIYTNFLNKRAKQLDLSFETDQDYATVRLACMMRATPQEAKTVKDAFTNLPQDIKAPLQTELMKKGTDDGKAILLYYAPAFLQNIRKTVEKQFKDQGELDPFKKAADFGLRKLAEIYQEVRTTIPNSSENGVHTVDIADRAKEALKIKISEQ